MKQLERAADQLIRIMETTSLNRPKQGRQRLRTKAIELMTATIKLFDGAVVHFGSQSLCNPHFGPWLIFSKVNFFEQITYDTFSSLKGDLDQAIENYDNASKDEMHYNIDEMRDTLAKCIYSSFCL